MNIRDYYKLCDICDNILLDNKSTETTISMSSLHIIRDHPVFLKQYDSIYSINSKKNNINNLLFVKYFLSLLKSIFKCKIFFYKYWVSSQELKKSYDFIFISHLLNEEQAGDNRDFYYDYLPRDISNMGYNVLVVLLNHTNQKNEKLIYKWGGSDITRLILSKQTGILNEIYYYYNFTKEAFRLKKIYAKESDILKKNIIKLTLNQIRPTINNLQFALQFKQISKFLNPKNAIITYEGHAWERLAFSNLRKYSSTKIFAYQHALIFKNQHAIKRDLQNKYNPNFILTSGIIGKNILLNSLKLKNIDIDILGSNRATIDSNKIKNISKYNKSILVLPEGIEDECILLFEHSYFCAIELPDVKFIWRLHPIMNFKQLTSKVVNFNLLPSNIEISKNTLEQDITKCNFVLYRGTTAVINCVMNGLRPIYLKDNNDFNIDPLHEIINNKHIVQKTMDTIKLLNTYTDFDNTNVQENNILIKYASFYFAPLEISKLLDYKN